MTRFLFILVQIFALGIGSLRCAEAEIYYVDNVNGSDANSGTSQTKAWNSISKVNDAAFQPGRFCLI